MSGRRLIVLLPLAWASVLPTAASGQNAVRLLPADTAALFVVALDTIRTTMWQPFSREDTIWLRPDRDWLRPDRDRQGHPSSVTLARLVERFPALTLVEEAEQLFECPPGVEVRMPGQGCPIRGGGRIVRFGRIVVEDEGTVRLRLSIIHSADDGSWTQLLGQEVRLIRTVDGLWVVADFLGTLVS